MLFSKLLHRPTFLAITVFLVLLLLPKVSAADTQSILLSALSPNTTSVSSENTVDDNNQQLPKKSILEIFDQFVIAETAAKNCLMPSQELFSKFDSNFDVVSNFAFQELSNQYPYINHQQISQTLALKARALSLTTQHLINSQGCNSPDIQHWIESYHSHAKWQISNAL